MKQVRKCSRNTSEGSRPPKSCSVQARCISKVRSTRSRKYGIHPVPPSESATRRSGKFFSTRDHSRSAAADWMFIGCRVIITSGGESTAGIERRPDDPRWIESTVPVSQQAFHTGFQYSS